MLREAVVAGVTHIDTSDFYDPHVVNELIREVLAPYPDDLVLITKVGAVRGDDGSWNLAASADDLRRAVEGNLRNLGLERLEVVNFRAMLGVSNVTERQVAEARGIAPVVCVQNQYNLVHRKDEALIDALAAEDIAYVTAADAWPFTCPATIAVSPLQLVA